MTDEYKIIEHQPLPYISLSSSLPMSQLPTLAEHIPRLYNVLASTDPPTQPTGAPFFRYHKIPIGMGAAQLIDVEVGILVPETFDLRLAIMTTAVHEREDGQSDGCEQKMLPGGRYLETIHVGAPQSLLKATKDLLQHAEKKGLEFDVQKLSGNLSDRDEGGDGAVGTTMRDVWAARIEWYESDPGVVKDMDLWTTRLSFKLA